MTRPGILAMILALATAPMHAADEAGVSPKWKFAGENQGISFHLRIAKQCREGSQVSIRLTSALENPVTISFRLNDADWRKTFTRDLAAGGTDTSLQFTPDEGTVCNPYIDQVYLESKTERVTHTEDTSGESGLP